MLRQTVVCPECKSNDIEWVGDPRFQDNWFCYGCGRYFGTPLLKNTYIYHDNKTHQHA